MTVRERQAKLDPRHHHFVWVPDPWHYKAFAENSAVFTAVREGRLYQPASGEGLRTGPWMKVWYSADRDGKLIGEWGSDIPESVQTCKKCGSANVNGSPLWCANCGLPYPQ